MSEISLLSSQWETLGKTTDRVNNAVIAFKKQALLNSNPLLADKISLQDKELSTAFEEFVEFADQLLLLENAEPEAVLILPNDLVEQLKSRVIANDPAFFDKINAVKTSIKQVQPLKAEQLELLDLILATMDHERSELFKKLRTARG